jgi:chromosome segregation ATPase
MELGAGVMVKRTPEPFSIQLPAAIVLTLITSLGSIFAAYYALKGGVEAAQANTARLEARVDRLDADRKADNAAATQMHVDLATVTQELKNLNVRVQETNDRLGRIEDRQVRIIVPAVTDRSR